MWNVLLSQSHIITSCVTVHDLSPPSVSSLLVQMCFKVIVVWGWLKSLVMTHALVTYSSGKSHVAVRLHSCFSKLSAVFFMCYWRIFPEFCITPNALNVIKKHWIFIVLLDEKQPPDIRMQTMFYLPKGSIRACTNKRRYKTLSVYLIGQKQTIWEKRKDGKKNAWFVLRLSELKFRLLYYNPAGYCLD